MHSDDPYFLYRIYGDRKAKTLLYVGISASWTRRMSQHNGMKEWFGEVVRVDVEDYPNEASARAAEKAAIRSERPLYNIQHNRVTVEVSFSAEVSAGTIAAVLAVGTLVLMLTMWAGDALATAWVRRKAASQGIDVQLPAVRNPFSQEPPSALMRAFCALALFANVSQAPGQPEASLAARTLFGPAILPVRQMVPSPNGQVE